MYPSIIERYGSLSATGLSKESVFGTPISASTFLPMTANTMETDPGWFSPDLMMAIRDKQVFNLQGEEKFAGAIDGPLFPSNAMELIVSAIGADTVSGSGPYLHTISTGNTLPSLTIEKNIGNYQSLQFAGSRVSKLSIKAPVGNSPVEVSADMMAQSAAILTTPTAVSITNELPFTFAEASLTFGGHARTDVTNCTLEIDNGLKETYTYSGNHGPSFITPVSLKVPGTFDVVFSSLNDSTYGDYQVMANQSLGSLVLAFAHPTSTFGISFSMPQVAISKYANDIKAGEVILSTMSYEASYSIGSGRTLQAVITNSVSSQY